MTIELRIALPAASQGDPGIESVGALFDGEGGGELPVLFAHGSGAGMEHPFMAAVAGALAARGHPVLRFRYPYMERMAAGANRRPPDRFPVLEPAHRAAAEALAERTGGAVPVFLGKSMGCRVGAKLAVAGVPCRGLAFLGYPLHPPKKPDKQRTEDFPALTLPALFVQGTRDALCDLTLLEAALPRYAGDATLEVVEGADHGFSVLARLKRTADEVHADLAQRVHTWTQTLA